MTTATRKTAKPRAKKAANPAEGLYVQRTPAERWQPGAKFEITPLQRRGHRVQRVLSGLLQLETAGRISLSEVAAGLRWQRDLELAIHGARDRRHPEAAAATSVCEWVQTYFLTRRQARLGRDGSGLVDGNARGLLLPRPRSAS